MNFKFNKTGTKKYIELLKKRTNEVRKKYIEILSYNLYNITPKDSGAMASNYNISINTPDYYWNPDKVTPDFTIPSFTLKDEIYITNSTPYIMFVNYGTSKQIGQNFIQAAEFKSNIEINDYIKIIGNTDY